MKSLADGNSSYNADVKMITVDTLKISSAKASHNEVLYIPKLRCRVIGAFFEKLGSNSFAVYSIAVTDAENTTWYVYRRYRNFERLHRHLRDIPNYTLQLPPKRIFSSSTEDSFVHQRCIQLDKNLQGLLSIPNVAEQHEVWDFLSASSKNYSFGKSSSVITTLADLCKYVMLRKFFYLVACCMVKDLMILMFEYLLLTLSLNTQYIE